MTIVTGIELFPLNFVSKHGNCIKKIGGLKALQIYGGSLGKPINLRGLQVAEKDVLLTSKSILLFLAILLLATITMPKR